MTDNELTGRELAVACARAMGWTYDGACWTTERGIWQGCLEPDPSDEMALAWLHERGVVQTASSRLVCDAMFMAFPSMDIGVASSRLAWLSVRGSNLTESLQRLVVAVAQRGSGGRA